MNPDTVDDDVAYTRLHFEEGLLRAGVSACGDGWAGCVAARDGPVEVIVTLPPLVSVQAATCDRGSRGPAAMVVAP